MLGESLTEGVRAERPAPEQSEEVGTAMESFNSTVSANVPGMPLQAAATAGFRVRPFGDVLLAAGESGKRHTSAFSRRARGGRVDITLSLVPDSVPWVRPV